MALGAAAQAEETGKAASEALSLDRISFLGDSVYPAGGTPDFAAHVAALLKSGANIAEVIAGDCGGYIPAYDHVNDKLKVYYADNDAGADSALIEVQAADQDLSAVTFNLTILSY